MTSLLTNAAALTSLRDLGETQRQLARNQAQVSSGLRVATASDAAAYWSIGTAMRSEIAGLDAVQDGLALTKSIADVTASALASVITLAQGIEADIVTASQAGVDPVAVQRSIAAKQSTILSIVNSASFNGVNWLKQDAHYTVSETVTYADTESITQHQLDTATYGQTWHHTATLDDAFTVTDPFADVSTFDYHQPTENWDVTYTSNGNMATNLVRPTPSVTEADRSRVTAGQPVPFSADQGGIVYRDLDVGRFTLLADVDVTTDRTSTTAYASGPPTTVSSVTTGGLDAVGTAAFWSDETDPGQSFLQTLLPSSPLTSLLAIDVTDPGVTAAANQATVAGVLASLTTIATSVGALQTQVATQQDYNASLSNALASGLGTLVDADLNVASTRLQALQTQQQLGIQALSIANQESQSILKLFQMAA